MIKLPNGISNYERLVEENYYYVDKTSYIEKMEKLSTPYIMFLRPRKFGKTLFTSVLENYYDILKKDKFETLFGKTYIGKKPTGLQNTYHILKFNFSGIDTTNEKNTMQGFKDKVILGIERFINSYGIEFYINKDQTPEAMLGSILEAFKFQKENNKIYVIIDEYDHFANELLGFRTSEFKTLVSKNGKVRKWYEVLKEGTESVVDRIFITGVAPITLDSLTSGFNISKDITKDIEFNEMVGFTKKEIIELMDVSNISQEEQSILLPIMKENYDGYKFSISATEKMYNSNMSLYFLSDYVRLGKIPEDLVDSNILSDYSKLGGMLNTCTNENKQDIIEKTLTKEGIMVKLIEKFNPEIGFGEREFASMLFYLGYLTIDTYLLGMPILQIPNKVMKDIYSSYFVNLVNKEANFIIESQDYTQMLKELAFEGKIDTMINRLEGLLQNLSNRDFQRFDEKYVKVLFYSIAMNLTQYLVKSEMEVKRKYPDLLLVPMDRTQDCCSVMIEFKYLKKDEANKLEEMQKQAKEQIKEYSEFEDIKNIPNLSKYTVIAVVDKIYVEKI